MRSMESCLRAAMERAMKVQEVMLQAMAKKITWFQAAEIIGISDRHMRRWRERYEESGFRGLFDRRRGKPSPKRVPMAVLERVLELYRCDLKVAEMIVCRKDQFIRRAVPSALPYEAWREGNDSSWNPPTTYPAIERSASEPRGDGAAASIKVARGQG